MVWISQDDLTNWFTIKNLNLNQIERTTQLHNAARVFAFAMLNVTHPGADQTAAIRKIREALAAGAAAISAEDTTPDPAS
jgi:hypothetical protein